MAGGVKFATRSKSKSRRSRNLHQRAAIFYFELAVFVVIPVHIAAMKGTR